MTQGEMFIISSDGTTLNLPPWLISIFFQSILPEDKAPKLLQDNISHL